MEQDFFSITPKTFFFKFKYLKLALNKVAVDMNVCVFFPFADTQTTGTTYATVVGVS